MGTYKVTVTDANGETASTTAIVESSAGLSLSTNPMDASCGANNGSIDLSISGGQAPYEIDWDNNGLGDTNDPEDLTDLAAGIYNVTVTDVNGCSASTSETVSSSSGLTLTTTKNDASCGANNGSIDLTISGGQAPYEIDWDNNGIGDANDTEDLTDLAAGTYNVTVTDVNGCSASTSESINASGGLSVTPTLTTPSSCIQGDGSISLAIAGGTAPYTVDWLHIVGSDDGSVASNLSVGIYDVTITDAAACSEQLSIELVHPSSSLRGTFSTIGTNCSGLGGRIIFNATGGNPPYQFSWQEQDPIIPNWTSSPLSMNPTFTADNITRAVYEVVVSDANFCAYVSVIAVDYADDLLQIQNVSGVLPDCNSNNGSITISTINGIPPLTYELSDNDQVDLEIGSNNASYTFSGLAAATYEVTVRDKDGCIQTQEFVLKNNTDLTVNATVTDALCANNGAISLNISGGDAPYQVDWSHLAGNNNPQNIDQLLAGTYAYTVTDAVGCKVIGSEEVTYENPLGASFTTDEADCTGQNGSISFSASNGTPPYIYSWREASNTIGGDYEQSGSISSSNYTKTGLSSGSYDVKIEDSNGCERTGTVTIGEEAGPSISYNQVTHNCSSGGGTISTNVNSGTLPYAYKWATSAGAVVQEGPNKDLIIANISQKTVYKVTVTDGEGCTDAPSNGRTLYKKLTADPRCETTSTNGVYTVRSGKDGGSSQVDFNWTLGGTAYPNDNGFFNTAPADLGRFDVTITDNVTNCTATGHVVVPTECASNSNSIEERTITDPTPTFEVRLYPNPFQNQFTMQILAEKEELVEIKLIDLVGRILYEQSQEVKLGSNKITIDLESTATDNGVYQLLLIRADGTSEVQKLIRE